MQCCHCVWLHGYSTCLDSRRTAVRILVRSSIYNRYVIRLIFWSDMALCSLFVLKVPLDTNRSTYYNACKRPKTLHLVFCALNTRRQIYTLRDVCLTWSLLCPLVTYSLPTFTFGVIRLFSRSEQLRPSRKATFSASATHDSQLWVCVHGVAELFS